ncbi:hypothetical protein DFP72DRAFT_194633 [Ephemerocybe angulata]|uniref:Uncharacterized protein n=1 Tax=Ephemerocybe angulata TaxID=980116 RepID=A0A8H6H9Z7_9AGAR|nr:hypothetical protein DFP72DRAFT_194633 [Tulosesus angulatus]
MRVVVHARTTTASSALHSTIADPRTSTMMAQAVSYVNIARVRTSLSTRSTSNNCTRQAVGIGEMGARKASGFSDDCSSLRQGDTHDGHHRKPPPLPPNILALRDGTRPTSLRRPPSSLQPAARCLEPNLVHSLLKAGPIQLQSPTFAPGSYPADPGQDRPPLPPSTHRSPPQNENPC